MKILTQAARKILAFTAVLFALSLATPARAQSLPPDAICFFPSVSPESYLAVSLDQVPDGYSVSNDVYTGWCIDAAHGLNLQLYCDAILRDSTQPRPPHLQSVPVGSINHILNNRAGFLPGSVQAALWGVSDGLTFAQASQLLASSGLSAIESEFNTLVAGALANPNYVPAPGAIAGVILDLGPDSVVQRIVIEVPNPVAPCVFLVIDEDSIDNTTPGFYLTPNTGRGVNGRTFTARDVNDDRPRLAQRTPLRFFNNPTNFGRKIIIRTGQVGDEGLFAVKTIPDSWKNAGPTGDGLMNFVGSPCSPYPHGVGDGLGTGNDPEAKLDKIPKVTPLRAKGLNMLVGSTVCALVYDSDVSINYGPLNGSLKGETLGVVAFKVLEAKKAIGFSSSTLPLITIEIVDPCKAMEARLFTEAPEPPTSSIPADIDPISTSDDWGY